MREEEKGCRVDEDTHHIERVQNDESVFGAREASAHRERWSLVDPRSSTLCQKARQPFCEIRLTVGSVAFKGSWWFSIAEIVQFQRNCIGWCSFVIFFLEVEYFLLYHYS